MPQGLACHLVLRAQKPTVSRRAAARDNLLSTSLKAGGQEAVHGAGQCQAARRPRARGGGLCFPSRGGLGLSRGLGASCLLHGGSVYCHFLSLPTVPCFTGSHHLTDSPWLEGPGVGSVGAARVGRG